MRSAHHGPTARHEIAGRLHDHEQTAGEGEEDEDETLETSDDRMFEALRGEARTPGTEVADWGAASGQGSVRQRNEDAWGQLAEQVFVVADGMGGYEGGDLAAQTAVRAVLASIGTRGVPDWNAAVVRLNQQVRIAARARGFDRAGTAIALVSLVNGVLTVVNVGDVRVYRLRHGRLVQLTRDHTIRAELLATGADLRPYVHRRGILDALTRHLGSADETGVPDVTSLVPTAADRLLILTDGVHQQVTAPEMAAAAEMSSCDDAARTLVELADTAGGLDNATAVVISLQAANPHPTIPGSTHQAPHVAAEHRGRAAEHGGRAAEHRGRKERF
jgi:protein phosphatase